MTDPADADVLAGYRTPEPHPAGQGDRPARPALPRLHRALAVRHPGDRRRRRLARRLAARRRPGLREGARRAPRSLLPDRQGNNRVDGLRNVVANPRVALMFFVPGIDETLRVFGTATLLGPRRARRRPHRVRPGAPVGAAGGRATGLLPVREVGHALGSLGPGPAGGAVGVRADVGGLPRPLRARRHRSRTTSGCARNSSRSSDRNRRSLCPTVPAMAFGLPGHRRLRRARTSWPTGGPRRSAGPSSPATRRSSGGWSRRRTPARRTRPPTAARWCGGRARRSPPPTRAGRGCSSMQVPEAKTVKNRLHLDLRVGAERREEEVARLIGLGATELWRGRQGPHGWVTLADPRGQRVLRVLSRHRAGPGPAGGRRPSARSSRRRAVAPAVCGRSRGSGRPPRAAARRARWPARRGGTRRVGRAGPWSWRPLVHGGRRQRAPRGAMVPGIQRFEHVP